MFITVNGVNLHYEVEGSGPAMVMIHDNCLDLKSLDHMAEAWRESYELYRVDSRGHGESQAVQEFHYQDIADDVFHFITALNLEKPIYFGHGDGAVAGLLMESQHPGTVSKMVLAGANTTPDELDGWDVKKYQRWERRGKALDPRIRMLIHEPDPPITAEALQRIKVPVYLTVGEYDIVNRADSMFILKNIPDSEMYIQHNGDRINYVVKDKALGPTVLKWLSAHRRASPAQVWLSFSDCWTKIFSLTCS